MTRGSGNDGTVDVPSRPMELVEPIELTTEQVAAIGKEHEVSTDVEVTMNCGLVLDTGVDAGVTMDVAAAHDVIEAALGTVDRNVGMVVGV